MGFYSSLRSWRFYENGLKKISGAMLDEFKRKDWGEGNYWSNRHFEKYPEGPGGEVGGGGGGGRRNEKWKDLRSRRNDG